ncbi:MAG TPA: hypothetical protein VGC56_12525 [Allosphingosinicella sp.]|jgi:hypothetical protein
MSGDTVGSAMDSLFLVAGGLGFARLGWIGVNRRRPAAPSQAGADAAAMPPPARSTAWQIFSALLLLFGGFVALCGLILALSLLFPGNAS